MHTVLTAHASKAVRVPAVQIVSFSSTGECLALLRILVHSQFLLGLPLGAISQQCGKILWGERRAWVWAILASRYSLTSPFLLIKYGTSLRMRVYSNLASSPLMLCEIISVLEKKMHRRRESRQDSWA